MNGFFDEEESTFADCSNHLGLDPGAGYLRRGEAMTNAVREKRSRSRTYPRDLIGALLSPIGSMEKELGFVSDASAGGIGIASSLDLSPGTLVTIVQGEDEDERKSIGEVRWCLPDDYNVGIFHLGIRTLEEPGTINIG